MADMTAQQMILDTTDFNVDKDFMYTKPKINPSGGKSIGILNSKSKKSLMLQTPLMLTWGINEYVDEASGKRTYDMSLQFPNDDFKNENSEKTDKFLEVMKAMEKKLKNDAMANSKDWLNKPKMSADVCDALWTPMLKYPKYPDGHASSGEFDYTRQPSLRIKVPMWEGEWKIELYDMKGNSLFPNTQGLLPTEIVTKGITVKTIIQCGGLWFANGKFGVTWKLFQATPHPKVSLKGKCLIVLSDAEKAMLKATAETEDDVEMETTKVPVVYAEDSDEEEVVQEQPVVITKKVEAVEKVVPESVPVPVPVPVPAPAPVPVPEPDVDVEAESEPVVVAEADTSVKKKVVRKKPTA